MVKKTTTIRSAVFTIPAHNGRTDRFAISIPRVSMLTRDKNCALGIVLLELTSDRYEASRGLFATAELLVWTPNK